MEKLSTLLLLGILLFLSRELFSVILKGVTSDGISKILFKIDFLLVSFNKGKEFGNFFSLLFSSSFSFFEYNFNFSLNSAVFNFL